jgi:hypothetical protein
MHIKPWWIDIDVEKLMNCPPELSDHLTNSHVVASQEEHGEGIDEFGVRNIFDHISKRFFHIP